MDHDNRLDSAENLAGYLQAFRQEISSRVQAEAPAAHDPATDAPDQRLDSALRKPYPAQAHAITALVRTLREQPGAYCCGEMGVGKTLIGALAAWLMKPNGRTLIMCPGHLVKKWKREIELTVPGAEAHIISTLSDAAAAARKPRNGRPQFWVISKETGKLGYFSRPALKVKQIHGQKWNAQRSIYEPHTENHCFCPRCGSRVEKKPKTKNDIAVPIMLEDLQRNPHKLCRGELFDPENPTKYRRDGKPQPCRTPLWTADRTKQRKVAIADYFKRQKARFDLFIADEVHELKGADTAQGNALGKFASCARKVLALTGTLIGGYSSHLFFLQYRMDATAMKRAGYTYGKTDRWVDKYGVREIVIKETVSADGRNARSHGTKTGTKTGSEERPGISPALFADQLLNNAIFLHLEDVAQALPPITEEPVPIEMSPDLATAYKRLEADIKSVMDAQLAQGNRRLLGRYLVNLLSYPDKPYQNEPVPLDKLHFAVPAELPQDLEYPKEEELIRIATEAKARGRKTLVFLTFTGKRDQCPRVKKILEDHNLKTAILYAQNVDPRKREAWIEQHAPGIDVLITNPECVKTGLDLLQFPTVVYLQTGYNVFTLRQSSRRSWRIGQKLPVEIFYLYYTGTMQARAINLIGRKLSASQALEGKLTAEGLQALAGEDEDEALALARALCQGGLADGIESTWKALNEQNRAFTATEQPAPEYFHLPAQAELSIGQIVEQATPKPKTYAQEIYEAAGPLKPRKLSVAKKPKAEPTPTEPEAEAQAPEATVDQALPEEAPHHTDPTTNPTEPPRSNVLSLALAQAKKRKPRVPAWKKHPDQISLFG